MAQNNNTTIHKNVLAWRGCEKLYLDDLTADVFFIFNSENSSKIKRIPAHKSILSAVSEAFDAMFYGPVKESGEVTITDTSPEAFEEFLQYFYRSSVKLTAEYAPEVMNLCKQYLLNDSIKNSTKLVEASLTLDNACWFYELAILHEEEKLKKLCEQMICENPKEIFQSNSFLTCESNLMRHILQLNSLKCEGHVVFDGFMAWAKAACILKGIDEKDVQNLRIQLGDLFNEIFKKMTLSDFVKCYESNVEHFSLEDYRNITMTILRPNEIDSNFAQNHSNNENLIICKRIKDEKSKFIRKTNEFVSSTSFSSNFPLSLIRIYCAQVTMVYGYNTKENELHTPVKIRISTNFTDTFMGELVSFVEVSLSSKNETIVELPKPLLIKPGIQYRIQFMPDHGWLSLFCDHLSTSSNVECSQGIAISFKHNGSSCDSNDQIIYRMDFVKQNESKHY